MEEESKASPKPNFSEWKDLKLFKTKKKGNEHLFEHKQEKCGAAEQTSLH